MKKVTKKIKRKVKSKAKRSFKSLFKKLVGYTIAIALVGGTYYNDQQQPAPNPMLEHTEITFIDVGQGDSSLIITGDQTILIDAGPNYAEDNVVEFIKSRGITTIDLLIGTHPHEDHIGGIDAVIENFNVELLLMPEVPHNTITYESVITAANENGTQIITPDYKTTYEFKSGLTLKLLTPPSSFESSDLNDDSIVCEVIIGDTKILYTGDMEAPLENALMNKFSDVDILKAGHHGSNSSSTEAFLDTITAEMVIISCGWGNRYSHPHEEILERFSSRNMEIRRTDLEGNIQFIFDATT